MEQFPRKSQPKNVSHPVVSSVDQLVQFGQEKPKVKKSKKPKRKEDIDPLVWDDIMSSVCREPQDRYTPGFQNFPDSHNLPEHLMSSNVATNISYEKISKDTIAPTLLWDLPPVGFDPVTPSVTPQPETPTPPSVIGANDKPIKKEDTETRPTVNTTAETEDRPNISLPPPTPPYQEREVRPRIPIPPPPVQKTEVPLPINIPPPPVNIPAPPSVNIPPPPPPPPMVVRRVPPAVPRPTRRSFEPKEEDLHSQLFAKMREIRSAVEEEPSVPKKDNNNNDDEWE